MRSPSFCKSFGRGQKVEDGNRNSIKKDFWRLENLEEQGIGLEDLEAGKRD